MAPLPPHPPVLPESNQTTIHRLLTSAIAEAHSTPTAVAHSFMAQWLRILENALPHRALWHQSRDLLWLVIEHLAAAGRMADTITWLEKGIAQSQVHEDPETLAKLQIQLGRERIHQGDPATAKLLLEAGSSYFEAAHIHYVPALNALAQLAVTKGQWDIAEQWVTLALSLIDDNNWREHGISHRLLGNIAYGHARFEEALSHQQSAMRWWRMSNQPRYIAFGLVNLGGAFRPLKRYAEAKAHYLEAILILEQVGDPLNRAYAQLNLGNVYLQGQEWEQAIDQYYHAEQVLSHSQQQYPLAILYNNWGMAYAGAKQWKYAIGAYHQSIALWTEMENFQMRANDRDNLGMAYMGLGQYEDALHTFHQALEDLQRSDAPDTYPLYKDLYQHITEAQQHL